MKGIKNIIFDLGAVILNIDYQRPQLEFEKLGVKNVAAFYSKKNQVDIFDILETGKLSEQDFVSELLKETANGTTYQDIIHAWNSILLDFPLRRLQILQQLQLHYNIYLLSNTNEIHEKAFNTILQQTCGYPNLGVFFDKVYLSHRVGLRKPDPAIFELVLQENNLKASETLFIDDSPQHIATAKSLGIQTIHLTDDMTIEEDVFGPKKTD